MAKINPYLNFNGECEEAFELYKKVFNKEFSTISRFGDMPAGDYPPVPEAAAKRILHVSLPISSETILMGSDAPESMRVSAGTNSSVSVDTDSREEADQIFRMLSQGGRQTMPMADTFWGAYFGMLTDRFGISWMVNFDTKKP